MDPVNIIGATLSARAAALRMNYAAAANWLDHGANLTSTAAYLWDLNASGSEGAYLIVCLCVPLVGLVVSGIVGALVFGPGANSSPAGRRC
jgi:hypothetical protein